MYIYIYLYKITIEYLVFSPWKWLENGAQHTISDPGSLRFRTEEMLITVSYILELITAVTWSKYP